MTQRKELNYYEKYLETLEIMATKPNKKAEVTDVLDPQTTTPDDSAIAVYSSFQLGTIEGDQAISDIQLPRLRIAYGVGSLAEHFNPGDWVLGDDTLLAQRGEPLIVIILTAKQYWKEYLAKFDPNIQPRVFETEDEVLAVGGTTRWENGIGPTFNRAMHMKLLIEKPEGVTSGLFGLELNDKLYTVACWDIDKSAYRSVGTVILNAARLSLRERTLLGGKFTLKTQMKMINNNNTVIPNIQLTGFNSDELIQAMRDLFNS